MSVARASRERARGALLGLAAGDALGTTLEFQPPGTFAPITDIVGGGPFQLKPGQWTDDTSMGLCLAESLIERHRFDLVDQLARYVRWWRNGHLSSTGVCFDIGGQTQSAMAEFERTGIPINSVDQEKAANGSIMRLAAVPIAYAPSIEEAVRYSAASSTTTHPASRPVDACRYLGALIAAAVGGVQKQDLLDARFWQWGELHPEIAEVASGSFKRRHPPEIRGTGYVVRCLEAALWALHNSDSFRDGALMAVNLGDDADTTGAVYGQIAGAIYGESGIPREWRVKLALHDEIVAFADRLVALYSLPSMHMNIPTMPTTAPPTAESYWVAEGLLAGKYPGAKVEREAVAKITALVAAGVRTFIDLTKDGELVPYAHLLPRGLQHQRIPVPDVTAPSTGQVREALHAIDVGRATGRVVYLHCWGGCGRTGVIVGCFLRESGMDAKQALTRVTELTRGVQTKPCPETPQQIKTIADWRTGTAVNAERKVGQGQLELSLGAPVERPGTTLLDPPSVDDGTSEEASAKTPPRDQNGNDQLTPEQLDAALPDLHPDQIPPDVITPEQLQRWRLCAGVSLQVAGRLDPILMRQLYDGDLPT